VSQEPQWEFHNPPPILCTTTRQAFWTLRFPAVNLTPPPISPPVATAAFDDDPLERLAKEISDLSLPDARKLLKMLEERI
jgi:hypothetical protein